VRIGVLPQSRGEVDGTVALAIELEATDSAQPVLAAYHALGDWLAERPRTTTLPEGEVPLEVINPSWEPHVRDRAAGTRQPRRLRLLRARRPARPATTP